MIEERRSWFLFKIISKTQTGGFYLCAKKEKGKNSFQETSIKGITDINRYKIP